MENVIYSINGPVVSVKGKTDLQMTEMVFVGNQRLIGEVIRIDSGETVIQVYEETSGLKPGDPVYATGSPLCITLGPGILSNIFDGIENPLNDIAAKAGSFIPRGLHPSSLNEETEWDVTVTVGIGDSLRAAISTQQPPKRLLFTK